MEHTQSYVFLPLRASGISPPPSPLSKQTSQTGRPTADLKTQVYQTRFCHQLKWPNWFRPPESSNWGAVLEAKPELDTVSGSFFTLQPSSKCSDTQSQGFSSSNLPHTYTYNVALHATAKADTRLLPGTYLTCQVPH